MIESGVRNDETLHAFSRIYIFFFVLNDEYNEDDDDVNVKSNKPLNYLDINKMKFHP